MLERPVWEVPVLELRFPGASLDEFSAVPLIKLLQSTPKLRALHITAERMSALLYGKIVGACARLQHFQYVGDVIDGAVSGEFRYMIMNLPSKWLIIAVANAFPFTINMPAGIERLDLIVAGIADMRLLGRTVAFYGKSDDFTLAVRWMSVSVRPGREAAEVRDAVSEFFARCLPNWAEVQALENITLNAGGFVADMARPADGAGDKEGQEADETEGKRMVEHEIRVSISDFSHTPNKWDCLSAEQKCYFTVTISANCRDNNDDAGLRRLSMVPTIRTLFFECPIAFGRFMAVLPVLAKTRNAFGGLVKVSVLAGAQVHMITLPDASLAPLLNLKAIFFQRPNQPFAQADVSECLGTSTHLGLNGICFANGKA